MSLTDRGLVAFLFRHYVIKDMYFESNGQGSWCILIKALRYEGYKNNFDAKHQRRRAEADAVQYI